MGGRGQREGAEGGEGGEDRPTGRQRRGRTSGSGGGSGVLRRWVLAAALVLTAAGGGYLLAAEFLFPAASPAETESLTPVPDLVGTPLEEGRAQLREAGLSTRVTARVPPGSEASEGQVLAQRPIGGQLAFPGDTVTLTVAAPEGPLRIPALRALREQQARDVLTRMGFQVTTTREEASVPRGEVVRTVPPAGEAAAPPSDVRVVLSEGPPVSGAPELVGRHIDDVRAILSDAGLALGAVSYDTAAFSAPGRVVGQSPPAGFSLREGERISVRVAGRPPESAAGGRDTLPGVIRPDTTGGPDTAGGPGPDTTDGPDGRERR